MKKMKILIPVEIRVTIESVNVEFAFKLYGFEFVIFKNDTDEFIVSEKSTGRLVYNAWDKDDCINLAKKLLKSKGKKIVTQQISKFEKLNP